MAQIVNRRFTKQLVDSESQGGDSPCAQALVNQMHISSGLRSHIACATAMRRLAFKASSARSVPVIVFIFDLMLPARDPPST